MPVKGVYLLVGGIGGLFLWSAIKGKKVTDAARQFIAGGDPRLASDLPPLAQYTPGTFNDPGPGGFPNPTTGKGGGTPSQNQALAKLMAATLHPNWIMGQQWQDWVSLWDKESGWSQYADTRKTGLDPPGAADFAYGIPQARPYAKLPQSGWPKDKGGRSDPVAQISWGIQYIAGRYGNPSAAWQHEQQFNWY